jgi:hypothetical protein
MTVLLGEKTFLRFVLGIELLAAGVRPWVKIRWLADDAHRTYYDFARKQRTRKWIPSFLLLRGMNMPSGKE